MVICREVQNTNEKYIKVYTVGGITEFVYIKDHPIGGVDLQFYSFFNLGARWGGWLKPRPAVGWASAPVWTPAENLALFCTLCELYLYLVLSWLSSILRSVCTDNTQHKHPCPRRDSNPQSQQVIGHRPTP